jgi:CheY-like chemotaxis protein
VKEPGRLSAAVLIVEDEPLIRMGAVYQIEDAGFEVYEAASADAAIALLELHKEIRLIFTDVDMPGSMDGLNLAHYVRGRWPPVKIMVTSGHVKVDEEHLPADRHCRRMPSSPSSRIPSLRLSHRIDDNLANSFFVGDVILNELSVPLILAELKARRHLCDFPISFLDAGIHSVPFDLLLLGHRAFDVNLTCPHVDDDVVGMGQRLRSFDA